MNAKEIAIQAFDAMPDDVLGPYLFMLFGQDEYIWEKCSKEEYEKIVPPIKNKDDFAERYGHAVRYLNSDYYAEPIYEDGCSPLDAIHGKAEVKVKEMRYHKRVGRCRKVVITSGIYQYLQTKRPAVFKHLEEAMEASVEMFNKRKRK